MATDPAFAASPKVGSAVLGSSAATSMTAPSSTTTIFTAGSSGSKIEQIRVIQVITTTTGGILNFFLHDGSNYYCFDQYNYNTGTISSTGLALPIDIVYNNLVLPSGWSLRVANTVASGSGSTAATHTITAFGGDF